MRLVSVMDASLRTGLKRTRLTALLERGEIGSVKLLDRRLVVVAELEAFIARQRERATRDGRVRVPPLIRRGNSRLNKTWKRPRAPPGGRRADTTTRQRDAINTAAIRR